MSIRPLRIAIIAEDEPVKLFLLAAIRAIANPHQVNPDFVAPEVLNGCRPPLLKRNAQNYPDVDLLVVGSDAKGPEHGKSRSFRIKKARLLALVGDGPPRRLIAVADPCVEAWLLADPGALRDGISAGLGLPCALPAQLPRLPRTEREVKFQLGQTVKEIVGGGLLPMDGFEYCKDIMAFADLLGSSNRSLQEWAREADRVVQVHAASP